MEAEGGIDQSRSAERSKYLREGTPGAAIGVICFQR